MSRSQNTGPEIHIDMTGIKMKAEDQNISVGWDGIKMNDQPVKIQTSMSNVFCVNNKCKVCIDSECFDFDCNDKTKIKKNDIYCGDRVVFTAKK